MTAAPDPTAPDRSNRRGFVIVAVVVVVAIVALAVGLIAYFSDSGDDAKGGRTDTQQVSDVAHQFTDAASKGDANTARDAVCSSDKSRYSNLSTKPLAQALPAFTLVDVKFAGPDATGRVKTTGQPDGAIYFHKDGNDWKLCPSSKAKFPG